MGAAVAGLSEDAFEELIDKAAQLSLASALPAVKRADGAWSLHPLLAALLRWRVGQDEAWLARMTVWFLHRLPTLGAAREDEQGERWKEIGREADALVDWLTRVPLEDAEKVVNKAQWYAYLVGPFSAWMTFSGSR